MDRIEQTVALARQAAAILPAPPGADDHDGGAAWMALVVATAERLGGLAGITVSGLQEADVPRRALTGSDLMALAGVAAPDPAGGRPRGATRSRRAASSLVPHHRCPGMTRVV